MTIWKKYSLGITLLALFIAAWAVMTWVDWMSFVAQQAEHHQPADIFGASGYIWQWGLDTFSNWQADFLGQSLAVLVGAYLIFKGSSESKDSSEEVQQLVQDIEQQVRGPEAAERGQRAARAWIYRGSFLRNYGFGYLLIGGFLVSWALMTWMGWMDFVARQHEHGQAADVFGSSGYIWQWARQTFMNWQSDALGHALIVIIPAYLLFKGAADSRGTMDRVQATLRRVDRALGSREQGKPEPGAVVAENRPVQSDQSMSFWQKYGLAIPSLAIFALSWILQSWTGWRYFVSEQLQHHQVADVFGASGYIWQWGTDTFANWQSDMLWAGLIVLFGAYLVYQGSPESKESEERIEQLSASIEREVRGAEATETAQRATKLHVLGNVWHHRGLVFSLVAAGIIAWGLMTWMAWMNFVATQHEHGQTALLFGSSGYVWQWATLTLENWQSDIMGYAVTVIPGAYLLYKGSAESRGSDDEIEAGLQRILQTLKGSRDTAHTSTINSEQGGQ